VQPMIRNLENQGSCVDKVLEVEDPQEEESHEVIGVMDLATEMLIVKPNKEPRWEAVEALLEEPQDLPKVTDDWEKR